MDELMEMLGKPDLEPSEEEEWKAPKRVPRLPNALVLIRLATTCRCGEKFVTPNKRIAVRFGKKLLGITEGGWRAEYNHLPREVKEFEDKVVTCLRCFDDALFSYTDFESSNGET